MVRASHHALCLAKHVEMPVSVNRLLKKGTGTRDRKWKKKCNALSKVKEKLSLEIFDESDFGHL